MIRTRQLAASGLLAAVLAFGQAEIGTTETAVTFTSGVNLVPVKVVVRDKQGRAVGNLTQDDFVLQDRGKDQTIVRFSVEQQEAQKVDVIAEAVDEAGRPVSQPRTPRAAVIPERFIAYIFDDVHTDIGDLMMARQAAVKQVSEVVEPGTRVAVYVTSGKDPLEFTDDLEEVKKKLLSIQRFSADSEQNDCPPLTHYWAMLVAINNDPQATSAGVASVLQCFPGTPADAALTMLRSLSYAKLETGRRNTSMGLGIVADVARRMAILPGTRSIVYVSSGFMVDQVQRGDEQRVFEAAVKAKVTVNTLDARGLTTGMPPMGQGSTSPALMQFQQRMQIELPLMQSNILGEFANATGGRFIHNTNAYEEGFRRVAAAPEFAYMLAFSPSGLKYDGSFHPLKIKLKARPGLDVKNLEIFTRSGYVAPNELANAEETSREELRDAVFARDEVVDVPVELSLQYFKSAPTEAHLTVVAKVNLDGVQFRKAAERNQDVLTVVSVVFDRNGNFVKGVQRVLDMKLRDETLEKLLDQGGISVRSQIDLPPGSYLVRLVVRDAEGKAMAMRNGAVEIPF